LNCTIQQTKLNNQTNKNLNKMKKITLFAVAIAIGFASFAQTAPAKTAQKTAPAKTEKKAPAKKDAKKVDGKKTDAKAADVKAK
jgi:hypothetical protein